MPLSREEKIQLIQTYEPILYFHPDEQVGSPVKPHVYMEASALWPSQPAGDDTIHDKVNWGRDRTVFPRQPSIPRDTLRINPADDEEGVDTDGDTVGEFYMGHRRTDGRLPYLVSSESRGLFLSMAGWEGEDAVTATSANRAVNVTRAIERWNTEPPLTAARDWYFAEVTELNALESLLATLVNPQGSNIGEAARAVLGDVWLIWYYFLYPVHLETLRACEEATGAGRDGNYEGDWTAVGVVVTRPAAFPLTPAAFPEPKYIGYSVRTRGVLENVRVLRPLLRQGMQVYSWEAGEVGRVGRHPKVFVAKDSHNNYVDPGPKDPPSITLGNNFCEVTDRALEAIRGLESTVRTTATVTAFVTKLGAGCGIGAAIGAPFGGVGGAIGCGIGALVGLIAAIVEAVVINSGGSSAPVRDAAREQAERDQAPEEGRFGLVLAPETVIGTPDVGGAAEVRRWAAPVTGAEDGHLVDRQFQIWWPGGDGDEGYNGRWGTVVQEDTNDRRSGIPFPDFRRAFLLELFLDLSEE